MLVERGRRGSGSQLVNEVKCQQRGHHQRDKNTDHRSNFVTPDETSVVRRTQPSSPAAFPATVGLVRGQALEEFLFDSSRM